MSGAERANQLSVTQERELTVFNVGIAAGFSVTLARDKVPTNWQPIGGVLSREKQRVSD